MYWRKLGRIWMPSGELTWAKKYASCPTPMILENGNIRIYIQIRDDKDIGRIGYVDVDKYNPKKIIKVSEKPVLDIGKKGAFDDNGVFPSSILKNKDGSIYLYYIGFELCHNIRYRLLTGLAVSNDGGDTFVRIKNTPILERSDKELFIRGGPFVYRDNNQIFKMLYVAGSEWELIDGKSMPVYDIRYIESLDGVNWPDSGEKLFDLDRDNEHGLGRPFIYSLNNYQILMYSIRKKNPRTYRIGHAICKNFEDWIRVDSDIGMNISHSGWDDNDIEYASIIASENKIFCFYNGNNFGETGFGLAELTN